MYGTTMIGTLAAGVSAKDIESELKAWETQRKVPGYLSSHVMVADDGKTMVNVAVFDSKESYQANAGSPEQDARYREFRSFLESDPEWHDGEVLLRQTAN